MSSCTSLLVLAGVTTYLWVTRGTGAGLISLAVSVVVFVVLRLFSVRSGARARDARILSELEPVTRALLEERTPERSAIAEFARTPHLRVLLYWMLRDSGHADLFPEDARSVAAQAEGFFAFWSMHPNEYGEPPTSLEEEATVVRDVDGEPVEYRVLRFRYAEPHWAAGDGALLAVVGPFRCEQPPYAPTVRAFARTDRAESTDREALIDWFVRTIEG